MYSPRDSYEVLHTVLGFLIQFPSCLQLPAVHINMRKKFQKSVVIAQENPVKEFVFQKYANCCTKIAGESFQVHVQHGGLSKIMAEVSWLLCLHTKAAL